MTQMLHYEKELNALSRLFLDFYLKTANLMASSESKKSISRNCDIEIVSAMQHCAAAMTQQKITTLLMEFHKTKK